MGNRPTIRKRPSAARILIWRLLWLANWGLLVGFFGGVGVLLGAYSGIVPMVPRLRNLAELRISEGTKILSADGEVLGRVTEENREFVPLEEIPKELKEAIVAVEDADFYRHPGIDPKGILRAAWKNLSSGRLKQGGSTITQQLARNAYNLRRRTLQRKVQEFLLALEIERRYTKDEILELYLNEIYFGEHAYGVKVAAKTYFDKEPRRLALAESALLAALPKAPTHYDPFRAPDRALGRRNAVLERMAEVGYITPEQAQAAAAQPLKLTHARIVRGRRGYRAPYFVAYVLQQAADLFGAEAINRGGLTIHTTLNWRLQQEAEKLLVEGVRAAKGLSVNQGALVALDVRTGAIKAMVGGLDFSASEFNRGVQGNRQVGSAFKPFVYAAAIDQGMRPDDIIEDSPVSYPDGKGGRWVPHNYEHDYLGPIPLWKALALSRNVATVRLMAQIGVEPIIQMAERMGLSGPFDPYLSLALGTCSSTPLEMASGYSVLASGGYRTEPYAIAKIEDAAGTVLDEYQPSPVRVLNPSTAETMTQMMSGVITRGTARGIAHLLPFPAAGKTGTTSDHKDAWFIGWADGLVSAVWVGNDKPIKMGRVTGARVPAPIWARFMKVAVPVVMEGREKAFVKATEIDRIAQAEEQPPLSLEETSGGKPASDNLPVGDEPSEFNRGRNSPADEPLLPPVQPGARRQEIEMVGICAVTGKRATAYCPRVVLRSFPAGEAPTAACPLHPDPYKER